MLISFYRRYFNPANSYIFLYGNADLDQELSLINTGFLSHYKKVTFPIRFPLQYPFSSMKEATVFYSTTESHKCMSNTFLSFSFVAGLNNNRFTTLALYMINDLLVNQESSPIRIALHKACIGKDVSSSLDEFQQNVMKIIVRNVDPSDKDKFHVIVMNAFIEAIDKGIDKIEIDILYQYYRPRRYVPISSADHSTGEYLRGINLCH